MTGFSIFIQETVDAHLMITKEERMVTGKGLFTLTAEMAEHCMLQAVVKDDCKDNGYFRVF